MKPLELIFAAETNTPDGQFEKLILMFVAESVPACLNNC